MAKKSGGTVSAFGSSMKDWQIERDLDTLLTAEQIQADSKRLSAAAKLAKERMVELDAVASDGAAGK